MYVEVVQRLSNLESLSPRLRMAPRSTASRPNGGRTRFSRSTAIWSAAANFSTRRTSKPAREVRRTQPARAATGERGVARIRKRMVAFRCPELGCLGRARGRQLFGNRSPKGRESRESTWSRCCGQRFASGRRRRLHDIDGERPSQSAASCLVLALFAPPDAIPRRFKTMPYTSSRSTRRRGS